MEATTKNKTGLRWGMWDDRGRKVFEGTTTEAAARLSRARRRRQIQSRPWRWDLVLKPEGWRLKDMRDLRSEFFRSAEEALQAAEESRVLAMDDPHAALCELTPFDELIQGR